MFEIRGIHQHRGKRVADSKECAVGLPLAVTSVIEVHTGDTGFVMGPDYRIDYRDSRAESPTGFLAEEAAGSQALLRGSARRT